MERMAQGGGRSVPLYLTFCIKFVFLSGKDKGITKKIKEKLMSGATVLKTAFFHIGTLFLH